MPERPTPRELRKRGDRVVVTWHRKEYAATVMRDARHMLYVETDEPYTEDGLREMHRKWFEVYDEFNDGRQP
jgi:hypothetical protein